MKDLDAANLFKGPHLSLFYPVKFPQRKRKHIYNVNLYAVAMWVAINNQKMQQSLQVKTKTLPKWLLHDTSTQSPSLGQDGSATLTDSAREASLSCFKL